MAINDDAFDARYTIRSFRSSVQDGAPSAETSAWMSAVELGFLEPQPEDDISLQIAEHMVSNDETLIGVYRREPEPGSIDEEWPVGTFATFPKVLSWGDGAGVNTLAISAVTVRATERRRGILRRMMTNALHKAAADGFAVASLTATEGTIYRRFGFGPTTRQRRIRVARGRALPLLAATSGRVAVVTPAYLDSGVGRAIFDTFHARTPGSMVRNTSTWSQRFGLEDAQGKPRRDVRAAIHLPDGSDAPDGYVTYSVAESESGYAPVLSVMDLVYTTDAAYLALWEYLLSIDLVDSLVYREARLDDPLLAVLADNRALTIEKEQDHIWLRVLDVAATVESRPFAADGTVTIAVADALGIANGTYRLTASGGSGSVERLASDTTRPDLALDVADLGALLVGTVSPVTLAAAGLLHVSSAPAVHLLRSMLLPPRTPHGITSF